MGFLGQSGSAVRLEWGPSGVEALGTECAVLIVVDVLSFCTTVDIAVGRGAAVVPLLEPEERHGVVLAGTGPWTLRPSSVTGIPVGTVLGLPSPNGARLCAAAERTGAIVFAGCLRNATAVAAAAHRRARGGAIGIVPAGEQWGVGFTGDAKTGPLRPGIEDHLGAGAIANALLAHGLAGSPEATLAAAAFRGTDLPAALHGCVSGRELDTAGHRGDIDLAARIDASGAAPVLTGGTLRDD
ncbi:2-phosphosulfolactate phosphatase [Amycolatopsis sp. CA-230715]|uniref:2-phosphosulfolactate phosphatase n=1 Tax=Amycolatopsis sp. CA-230715 TaxID=2745196 RepID=UPI001C025B90|nr:2-phosphosulfolactate phosphatase [Amycolatopsis sp. CA-230715]QWF83473.1 2-phosphosulfolactate phosphatase [Amycolatopsis sp. CA-230715]